MLNEVDGNLFGLVALLVLGIAFALVRLEAGHALGQWSARFGQARVRTIIDVGAAQRFGDYRQRTAVHFHLWRRVRGGQFII